MICLKCKKEDFHLNPEAEIDQTFRGETFTVRSSAMICTNCGWRTLARGQLDDLGRKVADAYRAKHNLLTSQQIRNIRHATKLSQAEFAARIGVGVASVKRWENWQVQDRSSDNLIRLNSDRSAFPWMEHLPDAALSHLWTPECVKVSIATAAAWSGSFLFTATRISHQAHVRPRSVTVRPPLQFASRCREDTTHERCQFTDEIAAGA